MKRFVIEHTASEHTVKQLIAYLLYQRYTLQVAENVLVVTNASKDDWITKKLNIVCKKLGMLKPREIVGNTEHDSLPVKKWPLWKNNAKYEYSILSKELREFVKEVLP
jgi:IMP cyclohydrolase